MAREIGGSVGINGVNVAEDVSVVQELLNIAPCVFGGPLQPIAIDGLVGPETIGAIKRFQTRSLGFADGRVDPNGKTLAKLNSFADLNGAPASVPAAKPAGGSKPVSSQSKGFAPNTPSATIDGNSKENEPNWALITSISGKVKMRFPGGGWLQAFPGFFLPTDSVLMTYDATGAPLTLPMTKEEFNSPYPWQPGSASVQLRDGTKRSFGPFSLYVVR